MRVSRLVALSMLLAALASPAGAHGIEMALMDVTLDGDRPEAIVELSVPTALLVPADDDHDNVLSPPEVEAHRAALEGQLRETVGLYSDDVPGELSLEGADVPSGPGYSSLRLRYRWGEPVGRLGVRYTLFPPDTPIAHAVARLPGPKGKFEVALSPDRPMLGVEPPSGFAGFASFFEMGVEHILTGWDHLLFLLALLLGGTGPGYVARVVTAFTLGHSVTLALGVLGWVHVPSRLVESLIALSIVVVALDSLRRKDAPHRWLAAAGFGLVHGLGFASALSDLGLAKGDVWLPLLGFNLGVEAGQLTAVALAWAALAWTTRRSWAPTLRRGAVAAVAVLGAMWFVERAWPAIPGVSPPPPSGLSPKE